MYHFYTTSTDEIIGLVNSGEGWSIEGIAFFVYAKEYPAGQLGNMLGFTLIPLFRSYNHENNDHLYTTSLDEALNSDGYQYESIAAWVLPADASDTYTPFMDHNETHWLRTTPLHRLLSNSGEHFYTANEQELHLLPPDAGYQYEGVACRVFNIPPPAHIIPRQQLCSVSSIPSQNLLGTNIFLAGLHGFGTRFRMM